MMAHQIAWSLMFFTTISITTISKSSALPFSEKTEYLNTDITISEPHHEDSWIFLAVLSIGSMISLVTVLLICGAAGCCGLPKIYWFGRSRQQTPMSFDNPVTELGLRSGGSSIPLSQIDVRALQLDPVVFEPLPTIHDLSPLSISQVNSPEEGKYNGRYAPVSFPIQKSVVITAFANEDSELYAHDWFDEPYRNFQRSNIEFVREVGKGWFGEVLEADANDIVPYTKTMRVIVKRLKQDASQLDQMRFLDESRIYRDANQGNVLKLLGHSIEKLPFLLFYESFPQGDLKSFLISNVTRAESLSTQGTLLNMALDIAKGLEWIINKGFRHPDLASRNCQVASEGRIVIGDYGLATQMFKDDYYWNSGVPIPLRWAAPETIHCTATTIQTLKVTEYSNIYTFGVVLWEITEFAKLPYFELSDEEVITRVFADKTYFLGHPSLPYIPFKDELYEVMTSCWSIDSASRPTASNIVTQLQQLMHNLQTDTKKDNDFELKWERLGKNSSPSSNVNMDFKPRGAKKSVSFTGIQNMRIENESLPTKNTSTVECSTLETSENRDLEDDEENDKWLKEMEDGGIAQKVMQKTHSVQDFMVLTHVEPSDIHGPESLMEIGGSYNSTLSSCENKPEDSIDFTKFSLLSSSGSNPLENMDNDAASPLLELSASVNQEEVSGSVSLLSDSASSMAPSLIESAASVSKSGSGPRLPDSSDSVSRLPDSASFTASSLVESSASVNQEEISASVARLPNSASPTSRFENINSSNQNISKKLSFESPSNVPAIAVQLPTPGTTNFSPYSKLGHHESTATRNSVLLNNASSPDRVSKRSVDETNDAHLVTNTTPNRESRPRRHTSTPKRSASSSPIPPLMNDSKSFSEDVFEIDSNPGIVLLNESCNLSPISMKRARRSGIRSEFVTTIVGASDDLGLGIFQGVTTQLDDGIPDFGSRHSSETDDIDSSQIPNGQVKGNKPLSCNGITSEARNVVYPGSESTQRRLLESNDSESQSWDVISNGNNRIGFSNGSSWDVVSILDTAGNTGQVQVNGNSPKLQEEQKIVIPLGLPQDAATSKVEDEKDINAFLTRQIRSLSTATEDTKSLLALSLETTHDESLSDNFVQDINAANQELHSVVLEDLENESEAVISESRHVERDNVAVKLAFTAGTCETASADDNYKSWCRTAVEPWDEGAIDNEIEDKQKESGQHFSGVHTGDKEKPSPLSTSFVPSTWNNSLTPVRPAIKSPSTTDIQHENQKSTATGLKKSVSFERQPRQVYEYPPPPPPVNDFEGDLYSIRAKSNVPSIPLHSSLDWDLTQEELEFAQNVEDSDEDDVSVVKSDPMDMYRISGFDFDDSFKVRGSTEPFVFKESPTSTNTLGQLRHTRDKLKLNLNKGEASLLNKNEKIPLSSQVLDSGVGSSTNELPSFGSADPVDREKLGSNLSSS